MKDRLEHERHTSVFISSLALNQRMNKRSKRLADIGAENCNYADGLEVGLLIRNIKARCKRRKVKEDTPMKRIGQYLDKLGELDTLEKKASSLEKGDQLSCSHISHIG